MNDSASVFEPWLLGREMASRFEETKFRLVLPAATLKRDPALEKARKQHRGVAGVYFWVMAYEAARYRIYIGKTKSLSGRLLDYTRDFQPRSADDFKVQIFKAFMMERI